MAKTPNNTQTDVCRLCDTTFTDKTDKHDLIPGALEVKPAYTVALEELTRRLVETTDELTAVCGSCRTLLNRYHRSSCEVERIGTLVKSLTDQSLPPGNHGEKETMRGIYEIYFKIHETSFPLKRHMKLRLFLMAADQLDQLSVGFNSWRDF